MAKCKVLTGSAVKVLTVLKFVSHWCWSFWVFVLSFMVLAFVLPRFVILLTSLAVAYNVGGVGPSPVPPPLCQVQVSSTAIQWSLLTPSAPRPTKQMQLHDFLPVVITWLCRDQSSKTTLVVNRWLRSLKYHAWCL